MQADHPPFRRWKRNSYAFQRPPAHDQRRLCHSAGEFVVQAPDAARYASILQAINDGTYDPAQENTTGATIGPLSSSGLDWSRDTDDDEDVSDDGGSAGATSAASCSPTLAG